MNTEFTTQQLNTFRPTMQAYGKLYGKALICPLCDNADKSHNEKVKSGAMHLAEPVKMFSTKLVVMEKFALSKDANDKPVIIINDDPALTFPLVGNEKPKIMECDPEKINDALRKYRQDKTITFFTDVEAVNKVITAANTQNANELNAMAEDLMNLASAILDVNKIENSATKEYIKSLEQI